MPLQNRVTPTGEIIAAPARGLLMGNRGGRIHTAQRTLTRRRWASRQWILCVLSFKGRQRRVMGNSYTELFFLDEVTGLAAGHRPCFECQRTVAKDFMARVDGPERAPDLDRILHDARRGPRKAAQADELPDGAMVLIAGVPHALLGGAAYPWSPAGYGPARPLPRTPVKVLTPAPSLTALAGGYAPLWHPSACGTG